MKFLLRCIVGVIVMVMTALVLNAPVLAAEKDAAQGRQAGVTDRDAELSLAPVEIDGNVLFRVRGLPAYPAEERAKTIGMRIEAIAADRSVAIDSLRVVELEDRTRLMAGDRLVVGYVDADGAADGVSRQLAAERALIKIKAAIASYRNDRSPRVLLINAGFALGATVLLALLLFMIRRTFRSLDGRAERRLKSRIEALEAQSHQIVQARQLNQALHGILKGFYLSALLVLGYFYLHFVLSLYPWTRPLAAHLLAIFLNPLRALGMGLLESLPGIAFVVVLAIATRYVLRVTRLYFEGIERGTVTHARFDREWALPTYQIARLLIIAFAVVVAYPYLPGSSSEAFKGVSILLGVVFSLGSSSVIANLMAGYAMIYRRAFKVGDRISIDNITGDVVERRIMVTHLRTIKNEEIVVPNSTIMNTNIINYSTLARSRGLILHTTVGIGYETPWRQVEGMLLMATERTPGLMKEPPPFIRQKTLGDFAVTYEINVYCDNAQAMNALYTDLHRNILDIFNEYGVQIMTPAYEGDPAKPKVVPKEEWFSAPATKGKADSK